MKELSPCRSALVVTILLSGITIGTRVDADLSIFAVAEEDRKTLVEIKVEKVWKAKRDFAFEDYLERANDRTYRLIGQSCADQFEARVASQNSDYAIKRPARRKCKGEVIIFIAKLKKARNFDAPRLPGIF